MSWTLSPLQRSCASSWPVLSPHGNSVCRDVSTVEGLMNDHQGLKREIEARSKTISVCMDLGKTLVLNRSAASEEVSLHPGQSPSLQNRQMSGPNVRRGWKAPQTWHLEGSGFSAQGPPSWLPRLAALGRNQTAGGGWGVDRLLWTC